MIFAFSITLFIFLFIYCICACRANRHAGIPNWWCAIPCLRLQVTQEEIVKREVVESDIISEKDDDNGYVEDSQNQDYDDDFSDKGEANQDMDYL